MTEKCFLNKVYKMYSKYLYDTIDIKLLTKDNLRDEATVTQWIDKLRSLMPQDVRTGFRFDFKVEHDAESGLYLPAVEIMSHGVANHYCFESTFFESSEYRRIVALSGFVEDTFSEESFIKRGERTQMVSTIEGMKAWLMKEASRGMSVQRYKGLGEMNPDQLWETTMDPDARRMLQVTIDDAIDADQMFTTLMGDEVEPRRNFIQDNALSVANLDV